MKYVINLTSDTIMGQINPKQSLNFVHFTPTLSLHTGWIFYRVIFLTAPPLKMSLDWPPLNFLSVGVNPGIEELRGPV